MSPEQLLDSLRNGQFATVLSLLPSEQPIYAVGGVVRDLLLGLKPGELDLVVEGDALAVAYHLQQELGGELRAYERFGTATLTTADLTVDVATTRTERYSAPGQLPEVTLPVSIDDDLLRRDFTVNAIALPLNREPELIAVDDALEDLSFQQLRVLHQHSFTDDPTRLFRLARYGARLGFTTVPETEALARSAVEQDALKTISEDRVSNELRLLIAEDNPIDGIAEAFRLGLDVVLPGLTVPDRELVAQALKLLPDDGDQASLMLTVYMLSESDRDLASRLQVARRPSEIARVVRALPVETVVLAGALGGRQQAEQWLGELRSVQLEITGDDLLAAGVKEGPQIGKALSTVLDKKLDGEVNGHEAELKLALEVIG